MEKTIVMLVLFSRLCVTSFDLTYLIVHLFNFLLFIIKKFLFTINQ